MSLFQRIKKIITSQVSFNKKDENPFHHSSSSKDSDKENVSESPHGGVEREYRANLEVSPDASFEDIRIAYKRLLKKYHPDLHASEIDKRAVATEITQGLNEAMEFFEHRYGKGV